MKFRNLIACLLLLNQLTALGKNPTSITLSPHLTELVYSAGGEKSLIGVSAYSNYPETATQLPVIGDAFRLDYELIKTLQPDVIFYWKNGTANQVIKQLEQLGFALHEINIDRLIDIPRAINDIAKALGTQPLKPTIDFQNRLNKLKQSSTHHSTALIQLSAKPIYTVNDQHWMSEAVGICGLSNIYSEKELQSLSAAVTLESVVLLRPDYVITTGKMPDNPLLSWPTIPAIKNNNIIDLNADQFTRPTLRLLNAIEDLCHRIKVAM